MGKVVKYKYLPTNQTYDCNNGGTALPVSVSPLKILALNTLEITKQELLASNVGETGTPGMKAFIDRQLRAAYANIYKR